MEPQESLSSQEGFPHNILIGSNPRSPSSPLISSSPPSEKSFYPNIHSLFSQNTHLLSNNNNNNNHNHNMNVGHMNHNNHTSIHHPQSPLELIDDIIPHPSSSPDHHHHHHLHQHNDENDTNDHHSEYKEYDDCEDLVESKFDQIDSPLMHTHFSQNFHSSQHQHSLAHTHTILSRLPPIGLNLPPNLNLNGSTSNLMTHSPTSNGNMSNYNNNTNTNSNNNNNNNNNNSNGIPNTPNSATQNFPHDNDNYNNSVFNDRGYEVCGALNKFNKPCQRIGRCPFHPNHPRPSIPERPPPPSVVPIQEPPSAPNNERRVSATKRVPYKCGWKKDEHLRFLRGLQIHGKGSWKDIANIVGTRTPTQIQVHAHRYYLRQQQSVKNKRSIHDFSLEDLLDLEAQQGPVVYPPHQHPEMDPQDLMHSHHLSQESPFSEGELEPSSPDEDSQGADINTLTNQFFHNNTQHLHHHHLQHIHSLHSGLNAPFSSHLHNGNHTRDLHENGQPHEGSSPPLTPLRHPSPPHISIHEHHQHSRSQFFNDKQPTPSQHEREHSIFQTHHNSHTVVTSTQAYPTPSLSTFSPPTSSSYQPNNSFSPLPNILSLPSLTQTHHIHSSGSPSFHTPPWFGSQMPSQSSNTNNIQMSGEFNYSELHLPPPIDSKGMPYSGMDNSIQSNSTRFFNHTPSSSDTDETERFSVLRNHLNENHDSIEEQEGEEDNP